MRVGSFSFFDSSLGLVEGLMIYRYYFNDRELRGLAYHTKCYCPEYLYLHCFTYGCQEIVFGEWIL